MALHFVSTSILSSDDGIAYSKEEQLESEDAKKVTANISDVSILRHFS